MGCPFALPVRVCSTSLHVSAGETKGKSHMALSCLHVQLALVLMGAAPARPGTCACHRLVTRRFVTRASALLPALAALPARCWPPARPRLVLAQHEGVVSGAVSEILSCLASPSRACGQTLVTLLSAPATLILQQRCSSRIEKPKTLLYLLYLLSLPYSPPLAKLN